MKSVFTPRPMVSFRSARRLNSYLVRAKLCPLERMVGSYKCNVNDANFAIQYNPVKSDSQGTEKIGLT